MFSIASFCNKKLSFQITPGLECNQSGLASKQSNFHLFTNTSISVDDCGGRHRDHHDLRLAATATDEAAKDDSTNHEEGHEGADHIDSEGRKCEGLILDERDRDGESPRREQVVVLDDQIVGRVPAKTVRRVRTRRGRSERQSDSAVFLSRESLTNGRKATNSVLEKRLSFLKVRQLLGADDVEREARAITRGHLV